MVQLVGLRPDHEFESVIDRTELLGEGTGRRVYSVLERSDAVIKESKGPFHYSNFVEWTIWTSLVIMEEDKLGNVPNSDLKKFFAPCLSISHSARYLMMERLGALNASDPLPFVNLPNWLNDKKRNAFGKTASGDIKVIDYGMVNFYHVLNPKNHTSTP